MAESFRCSFFTSNSFAICCARGQSPISTKALSSNPKVRPWRVRLSRQPLMLIEIDLQAEGQPGRDAHKAKAELFIDEIEV